MAGPSGLIAALGGKAGPAGTLITTGPWIAEKGWNVSTGQLRLRDGSIIYCDGADDGALRIQGKNLRGCWCDELGLWRQWKTAWDESIKYAVRLSPAKIIASGTPKANRDSRELVKRLIEDPTVPVDRLRTEDNADNLDPDKLEELLLAKGTRSGQQELEGELLADREGALVTWDDIIPYRVNENDIPDMRRVIVSVDPSFSNTEGSDECGITGGGVGVDGHGYILADWSGRYSLDVWAKRAVLLAWLLRANAIVYESNLVGQVVRRQLEAAISDLMTNPDAWVMPDVELDERPEGWVPARLIPCQAKLPKEGRLEVVAPLWQQHRIHHATYTDHRGMEVCQDELEAQIVLWAPGDKSPDRMDSCLVAGTMVITSHGEVPIESVTAGDRVLTREGWRPVVRAWLTSPESEVGVLRTSIGELIGTGNHPVWTENRGWVPMDALTQGDGLVACQSLRLSSTGAPLVVASVVSNWQSVGRQPVYNLTVEEEPEFFANGVLVHNCTQLVAELDIQRVKRPTTTSGQVAAGMHAASV
jgi:phage terminase large subunit-like protein